MDTSRTCPRCGNALQPNDKFCKNCGQPVDSGATQVMHPPMDSGATQVMHPSEAEAARSSYAPPPGPSYAPPPGGAQGYQPPAASNPQGYQPPAASGPGYQPPPGPGYQPPPGGPQIYQPASTSGPGYTPPPGGPAYTPPPGGPTYTPPPVAAPGGRPRWLFAVLGCLGLVIVGCLAFFAVTFFAASNLTQPMSNTGESFMTAVRDGNYPAAYALCTPALQQELGDISEFTSTMQDNRPTKWNFTSRQVNNNSGQLDGTATLQDGSDADVRLVLDQVGSDWKISGINIQPK